MTQWRAIPIAWGLSSDNYHRFLCWVAFKATFNGWGRCEALQVTFTIREVESSLGIKRSTVANYVARAKEEHLLLPTQAYSREAGKGEVYNLGGDLLMTVKTPGQEMDKDWTRTGQPTTENTDTKTHSTDKAGTSVGQALDVNRNTPDTPDTPPKRRKTKSSPGSKSFSLLAVSPIPAHLLPVAEFLVREWPVTSYGKSDSDIRKVHHYGLEDLWARIMEVSTKCGVEPGPLLFCGVPYLRDQIAQAKDTGKFKFAKDMKNFWGIKEETREWSNCYQQGVKDHKAFMEKQNG